MQRDQSIMMLGRAGESIVINLLSRHGHRVNLSVNQFDSQKDLTIDDSATAEVKTQVPYIKERSFTFRTNQFKKCKNVDFLYFVSVPNDKYPTSYDGKVYQIEPSKMTYRQTKTSDGREMYLIPIDQPDMIKVYDLTEDEIKSLKRHSVSEYVNG